jgi:hypothetical protein
MLYGITSERKRVEELRMHLAWRWFTELHLHHPVPTSSEGLRTGKLAITDDANPPHQFARLQGTGVQ